jgi:tetratricopeptide (TPR) repeat protein
MQVALSDYTPCYAFIPPPSLSTQVNRYNSKTKHDEDPKGSVPSIKDLSIMESYHDTIKASSIRKMSNNTSHESLCSSIRKTSSSCSSSRTFTKRLSSFDPETDTTDRDLKDILYQLTREINDLLSDCLTDFSGPVATSSYALVTLYSQRCMVLLEMVEYDADVDCPALNERENQQEEEEEEEDQDQDERVTTIKAVEQALDDALEAIRLSPQNSFGYFCAAQCSRCLQKFDNAFEFLVLALQLSPGDPNMQLMLKQIKRDNMKMDFFPRPLAAMNVKVTTTKEDIYLLQQRIKEIFEMPLLIKMEKMAHHHLHHQCAHVQEVQMVQELFIETIFLLKVLTRKSLENLQIQNPAKTKEMLLNLNHLLPEHRAVRKWFLKQLAPAIKYRLMTYTSSYLECTSGIVIALLSDLLILLTRFLLVLGNLKRCTRMPHALLYLKMAFDLSKRLYPSEKNQRYEMVCADAYAMGLVEMEEFGEALFLHQESLQYAIETRDRHRELLCHHYVGRTLMRMKEFVLAKEEFIQLVTLSQKLGDTFMESTAYYELGEFYVKQNQLNQAIASFKLAQTLCNKAGGSMLRKQSIQSAIKFYSSMKSFSPSTSTTKKKNIQHQQKKSQPQHNRQDTIILKHSTIINTTTRTKFQPPVKVASIWSSTSIHLAVEHAREMIHPVPMLLKWLLGYSSYQNHFVRHASIPVCLPTKY